ncbi:MAG: 30S ribosomal protein S4 [Thermoanaerobaculia bacterium]|nr:30S ribosomal protein S4 [Thermoanaerobaculia bacterium]
MKYTGPKVKLSRKLGIPLTTKAEKYRENKPYPPGQHGLRRRRRPSNYAQQLMEKQRLRYQYNVSEKQMRNSYKRASRQKGVMGENLVRLLEMRLDSIVHRAGLAPTMYAARQFVNHGHIEVNGSRVDIPSYQLQAGDVVAVREKSRKLRMFNELRVTVTLPQYLSVDESGYEVTVNHMPSREEIPVVCDVQLVVEYYSR